MATKKVTSQMSTEIALDMVKASESIKSMTALVGQNTAQWKAQEAQLKSAGDYLNATQARYDGLSESISNQQRKIDALKEKQSQLKGNTEETAKAYLNYDKQISQAETKLSSMTAQQNRAKDALEVQKSGVIELNNAYKLQMSVLESNVAKLKAQGQEYQALKTEQNGLKDSLTNLIERENKQKELLSKMSEGSDAYKKQEVRVNELGTKIAETTSRIRSLNTEIKEANPIGLTRINEKLSSINDKAEKTSSIFGKVFGANLLANGITSALATIQAHFSQLTEAVEAYNNKQQVMTATWKTLTGSAKDGQAMVDMGNKLASAYNQDINVVDELNQQFYHVLDAKAPTEELTKSVLTLSDTLGMSSENTERLGLNFTHMMSSSKMQLGDFNQITDQLPMYGEKLLEYEQQVQKNSKLTMSQLRDEMSAGKISATDAEAVMNELGKKYQSASENLMKTIPGMTRSIETQMPALLDKIYKPIANMQNPILGSVTSWIGDSETKKKFGELGTTVAKEMQAVTQAFGGASIDVKGKLDDMLDSINRGIKKLGSTIVAHKDDIKEFLGALKTSSVTTWKILWQVLKDLEPVMALVGKIAEKYPKQFAWMVSAGIIISKVSTPLSFLIKVIQTTTTVTSTLFAKLGLWKSKLSLETGEVEAQTKAYQDLAVAKAEASSAGSTSSVGSKVSTAESEASEVENTVGSASGLASTAEKEVASTSKLSKYLAIGKNIGGKLVTGAGLALTAWDVGSSITKAVTSNSNTAKYQAVGKTTGAVLGGGIGLAFGGPVGAAIGSQVGEAVGGSGVVTKALKKLKQNWDNSVNGYHLKSPKISVDKSLDTLEKAQKKYYANHAKQISKDATLLYKEGLITKSQYEARLKAVQEYTKKENTIASSSHSSQLKLAKQYAQDKQDVDKKYNAQRSKILDKYNNDIRYSEEYSGKNSVATKKLVTEKKKALDKIQNAQDKATAKLTQKYSTDTTKTYKDNQNKITSLMASSSTKQKTILQKLANDSKNINANNAKSSLDTAKKEYSQVVDIATKKYKKIKELADKQYQAVKSSAEKQQKSAIANASKQYTETLKASERQFKGNSDYAVKQRQKIASEASKQYESTVDSANKQYSKTVSSAKKQHDDTLSNAEKQRKDVTDKAQKQLTDVVSKADAQREGVTGHALRQQGDSIKMSEAQRKEVTNKAEAQRSQVVNSASDQAKGVLGHAVKQGNGSMEAQSKQAQGTTNMWDSILDFFNKLGKTFGFDSVKTDKKDFSYTPMSMPAYAKGTGAINKAQMALVGEAGAELAYQPYSGTARLLGAKGAEIAKLNQGEMILNANDTKKILEGNYRGILKGYASGTSTLEGFISKVKSGASNIWDNVSDSVGSILDDIKDPVKYLTDLANKAFNPTSVAHVGSVAQDLTKGVIKKSIDGIGDVLAKIIKGYDDGGASAPSGSGVQRWKDQVKKALSKVGLSTSDDMVNAWLKQIATESSGNEKAIQGNIGDINNKTGDLAKGLLQVISTTFNAYKVSGHNDIFNGYDNMLAAMSYAKSRYGSKILSVIGKGHGYENGGVISQHGMYEIAEKNKAEMVLPLTDKSRASQLLASIGAKFNNDDNSSSSSVNSSEDVKELNSKLDTLTTMFGTLLTLVGENVQATQNIGDKKARYTQMAKDMKLSEYQSLQ